MQEAIKPRLPKPMPTASPVEESLNPNARLARRLGSRDPRYENFGEELQIDWKRLGYVQMVTDHREVYSASAYSLASIFALIDFDRLLYLAPSGIIVDSLALDALLAFSPSRRLAALPDDPTASRISTNFMLIEPSTSTFKQLSSAKAKTDVGDKALFQEFFETSKSLLPPTAEDETTLYYESSELRALEESESFNSTQFLSSTAYVRLADPEIPGPEYDVPYGRMVQLRPKEDEPRWVWEKLYFKFRGGRMDICGLDLLVPTRPKVEAPEAALEAEAEAEAAAQEL
ncbi:Glycosyltransferase family 8 [Neofusicoccum parvum]|uniref:Uncharacterized protein n=1 Tax=Botryosphaeria parva (strain UCR-NP2) TaxID=1287680 RepID=R1EGI0_BOTPV|nr:hypothetical protein UCRNP2_6377 [Neofusicoccum parvum UCRNP2]GME61545.1 Glycosyltransferase family 8 [Neofusicoccum parvum]